MKTKQKGFTIVELLIVIVVIGILAAITIVAYNGIQNRARASAATSAAAQATKKVETFAADGTGYPASLAAVGINDNASTTYQYTVNNGTNPATYCLTATSGNSSYMSSSANNVPTAGGCPGHGVGGVAAITNLMPNPSFEVNLTAWYNAMKTGDTVVTSTTQAQSGTRSMALTAASSTVDSYVEDPVAIQPGTYTISAYVYLTSSGATFGNRDAMFYNQSGLSVAPGTVVYNRSLLNQWQRVSATFTTTTAGNLGVRFYTPNGTTYVDSVMLTQTGSAPGYADGASANWVWNGTAHNATSTGPSL